MAGAVEETRFEKERWMKEEQFLKVRRDVKFVASTLFTIALVYHLPLFLRSASQTDDILLQNAGFASLANIFVGLVVTWMGYVKGIRWTWFVMLIIVAVWAFPVLLLPLFQHHLSGTPEEWLYSAWYEPGVPRNAVRDVVLVSLMLIALILPIKSFLRDVKPN